MKEGRQILFHYDGIMPSSRNDAYPVCYIAEEHCNIQRKNEGYTHEAMLLKKYTIKNFKNS